MRGLRLRGGVWWINLDNKRVGRIYESTGASVEQRGLAEQFYHQRVARAYEERRLGVRRRHTFKEAAAKHLAEERGVLKSIAMDEWAIGWAMPHIGELELDKIHEGTLEPLKKAMALKGRKTKTVNLALQMVRKILTKAARRWRDEAGRAWIDTAPMISLAAAKDARPPYPLSWDEERKLLLPACPPHLEDQALFIINAGPREQELCALRWVWERRIHDVRGSAFILPEQFNKNGRERIIVLNGIAQAVVDRQRGRHPEFVFTFKGKPVGGIYNKGWRSARRRAADRYREVLGAECPEGFRGLHVHDLRHTFGRRLRAAGVSDETRADLLGHSRGNITTHYSAPEMAELFNAVRLISVPLGSSPTLTVLRAQAG